MDQVEKSSLKLSENFAKCSNGEEVNHLMQNYLQDVEQNKNSAQLPWPKGVLVYYFYITGIFPKIYLNFQKQHIIHVCDETPLSVLMQLFHYQLFLVDNLVIAKLPCLLTQQSDHVVLIN